MEEHMGVKLAEVEQRARSNTRRIEALERGQETLSRLTTSVEVMVQLKSQPLTFGISGRTSVVPYL